MHLSEIFMHSLMINKYDLSDIINHNTLHEIFNGSLHYRIEIYCDYNNLTSENILGSENILESENKNCIHTPTFAYGNSDEPFRKIFFELCFIVFLFCVNIINLVIIF